MLCATTATAQAQVRPEENPKDEKALETPAAPTLPPPKEFSEKEKKEEDIFQQKASEFFGKKNGQAKNLSSVEVMMPVFYGYQDARLGLVATQIDQTNRQLQVDGYVFMGLLRRIVNDGWFETEKIKPLNAYETQPEKHKWLALTNFADTGVKIEYLETKLELRIFVPADMRRTQASSLRNRYSEINLQDYDRPRAFSFYINMDLSERWRSQNAPNGDPRLPLRGEFQSAMNLGGTVLEGAASYTEKNKNYPSDVPGWLRGDVRLVQDFPSVTTRANLGDINYQVQTYQNYRPLGGFSVTRNFNLQPSILTYPTGEYEIFLKRPSRVDIWINDQLQKVLNLPSGKHILRDFPFANGLNDIRLEITDDVGRTETMDFSFFSSTELLEKGRHRFSYAVGSPWEVLPSGEREYDSSMTTVSAYHLYGVTENLTAGLGYQGDKIQSVYNLYSLYSTKYGYFRLEPAVSQAQDLNTGYAFTARYIFLDNKDKEKRNSSYTLGISHNQKDFVTLGILKPNEKREWMITAAHVRPINKNVSVNFGFDYDFIRKSSIPQKNAFRASLGFSKRWEGGLSTNFSFHHSRIPNGDEEVSAFAFLSWSFPKERQAVTAIADNASNNSRVAWNYSPGSGAGASNTQAEFIDEQDNRGYGGKFFYTGNRSRLGVAHEILVPKENENKNVKRESQHTTTAQLGTALVFAGGQFALTRPVTDSFVIIKPIKNLNRKRLELNPQSDDSYAAYTDWFGANAIPELQSYIPSDIKLGARTLPPGTAIPRDHFGVFPTYKSGFAYKVGTEATVYVTALLLDETGAPLSLEAGKAVFIADEDTEPVTIFTTRKGLMRSEGFRVGRYRLEMFNVEYESIEFSVTETDQGQLDLGTLTVKKKATP